MLLKISICSFVMVMVCSLSSCVTGKIFLYTPTLAEPEIQHLALVLSETGKKIELADRKVPANIHKNTLIFPYLLKEPKDRDSLVKILLNAGYQIEDIYYGGRETNHFYSGTNVGVYILSRASILEGKIADPINKPPGVICQKKTASQNTSKSCSN